MRSVVASVLFLAAFLPAAVRALPLDPDDAPFTSATVCAECHVDIHAAWLSNRHSFAASTPVFQEAREEARGLVGEEGSRRCLVCHAPTTTLTGDHALTKRISGESVTCDVCHSMIAARPGDWPPFQLDPGVKRGPYKDASAGAHPVAYSELHLSPELCASCHEYVSPAGGAVLTTWSEYRAGPYAARRVACQGCHMPVVMAHVVDPKVQRDPKSYVNLHRMPGGTATAQLRRGLALEIDDVRRHASDLTVRVAVANEGAGHAAPTGIPNRRLVLEVEARTAGGKVFTDQETFERVVVDRRGRRLTTAAEIFAEAASVESDDRLLPGERRLQAFQFPVPSGEPVEIAARLVYEMPSAEGASGEIDRSVIVEMRRELHD